MLRLTIDGACRRNGKPDCVSAGAVFIEKFDEDINCVETHSGSTYEIGSTNQRAELLGLLLAFKCMAERRDDAIIITDSEYLFNALTYEWWNSWIANDWILSSGGEVKNKDLWMNVVYWHNNIESLGLTTSVYHIKGHCIPFGAVSAKKALNEDKTGGVLLKLALDKYDLMATLKKDKLIHANELSVKNNGFKLPSDLLRRFVCANIVVDAIATERVVEENARHIREVENAI